MAAGALVVAGPWDSGQRTAERAWAAHRARPTTPVIAAGATASPAPAPSAGAVLTALGTSRAEPAELRKTLAAELGPLLDAPALGPSRAAAVLDVATGELLYTKGATVPMTPASTAKLATMTAALSALGPDHRIPTTVVADDDRRITLVGGGDATLSRSRLNELADDTARELGERRIRKVTVGFDVSLYSGPPRHPIGPNDNIAPVTALMIDEGRLSKATSGPAPRSGDPAGDAAEAFVRRLDDRGIDATLTRRPQRPQRRGASRAGVAGMAGITRMTRTMTPSPRRTPSRSPTWSNSR